MLVLALGIGFAVSAQSSLCGGGLKYTFGPNLTVSMTSSAGNLQGTYTISKGNFVIKWTTGYSTTLVYVSDGVFREGKITLTECK